ncbi:MAG: hypothetical protein R3B72_42685 [Polyangiaceae bacterium]
MPLVLVMVAPFLVVLLWVGVVHHDGSLLAMLAAGPSRIIAELPGPSWTGLSICGGWLGFQALLLVVLPGRARLGAITPEGNRPRYRLNGPAAFVVTHAVLAGAVWLGAISPTLLYDHFGEILMTSSLAALALCGVLYVKGIYAPSTTDAGHTGNPIRDFYWGTELHPTVLGVQLKQLFNARYAMMGWSAIVLSFAAKQWALDGAISPAMVVNVVLQLVYIAKFFVWEGGYFNSLDITHDRFGFYILWGVSAWLPSVYTIHTLYLVQHPGGLSTPAAAMLGAIGLAAIAINYQADAQRQRVRESGGRAKVWGHAPEVIHATYTARDGQSRESLLLVSGWWGVARHSHYVPELVLAVAWTLPVGFDVVLPWFYVVFLTVLLVDRAARDDRRCAKKYGRAWDRYRERVPYRIIPGLY